MQARRPPLTAAAVAIPRSAPACRSPACRVPDKKNTRPIRSSALASRPAWSGSRTVRRPSAATRQFRFAFHPPLVLTTDTVQIYSIGGKTRWDDRRRQGQRQKNAVGASADGIRHYCSTATCCVAIRPDCSCPASPCSSGPAACRRCRWHGISGGGRP